jgi:uncharacterized phage protein gp47/JayE
VSAEDTAPCGCGCCEGVAAATPVEVLNRPGLSAIAWRVGTHARFKESLLARISALPALRKLTVRDDGDLTVATMDAWAAVLDVLSFYQERIANEGFLRTATERRSLLELASAIGYEPRPGVAASVWLAFTLEDAPEAPKVVRIPAGTRAQSLPDEENVLPQPFETAAELLARPQWNEILVRRSRPQPLIAKDVYHLQGTETGLVPGGPLLVVPAASGSATQPALRRVVTVEPDADAGRTKVTLVPVLSAPPTRSPLPTDFAQRFLPGRQPFSGAAMAASVAGQTWRAADLRTQVDAWSWSMADVSLAFSNISVPASPPPDPDPGIYALRVAAAGFGYNAPLYKTLPGDLRGAGKAYPDDWDAPRQSVATAANRKTYQEIFDETQGAVLLLDTVYPGLVAGSWVVLEAPGVAQPAFLKLVKSDEIFRTDFAISGKVTRLVVEGNPDLSGFPLRTTTIFALSERLALSEEPIQDDLEPGITRIEIAGLQLELAAGRTLLLTGELTGAPGVVRSEPVVLSAVDHDTTVSPAFTVLTLAAGLENAYRRDSVRLNANAVLATHGESVAETLGSGDASLPFQRFTLGEGPLTWTSAPVASGAESTLEVRVDGVLWHEAPDLYRLGPRDREYTLRQDDAGRTRVLFGDGVHGARLPTGSENVTAAYRKGIGLPGFVKAGQVTLLDTKPLGVSEVVNPLPSAGAADRETRDEIRANAPRTVLTLDRIVSLRDHEDFASSFSGISKARAARLVDGVPLVHVTVAAVDGREVPAGSELHGNLLAAMRRLRDPFHPLRVDTFEPLTFNLELNVKVDPGHRTEAVLQAAESALRQAFSFAARDFAQGVSLSEVMAVAQRVDGVAAVDVDALYVGLVRDRSLKPRLDALPARPRPGGGIAPAQHLSLGAQGLTLGVMP